MIYFNCLYETYYEQLIPGNTVYFLKKKNNLSIRNINKIQNCINPRLGEIFQPLKAKAPNPNIKCLVPSINIKAHLSHFPLLLTVAQWHMALIKRKGHLLKTKHNCTNLSKFKQQSSSCCSDNMVNGGLLWVKVNLNDHSIRTILTRTREGRAPLVKAFRPTTVLPKSTILRKNAALPFDNGEASPQRRLHWRCCVWTHMATGISAGFGWYSLTPALEISNLLLALLSTRCPHNAKKWQRKREGDPTMLALWFLLITKQCIQVSLKRAQLVVVSSQRNAQVSCWEASFLETEVASSYHNINLSNLVDD